MSGKNNSNIRHLTKSEYIQSKNIPNANPLRKPRMEGPANNEIVEQTENPSLRNPAVTPSFFNHLSPSELSAKLASTALRSPAPQKGAKATATTKLSF